MTLIKNQIRFLTVVFVFLLIIIVGYLSNLNYMSKVIIGGKTYDVYVSDTVLTLSKGLSGRKSLSPNTGMIFVFDKPEKHGFWMKEMKFPIDIIWMDENLLINHIEKWVTPETYPKVFYPPSLSTYVLELNAGEADKLGLKLGQKVSFLR